jgi:hypothetical protein
MAAMAAIRSQTRLTVRGARKAAVMEVPVDLVVQAAMAPLEATGR